MMHRCSRIWRLVAPMLGGLFVASSTSLHAQVPGECTAAAQGRSKELGCYLLAETPIARISAGGAFWHIVRYPTLASAQSDRRDDETVVSSLGRTWLFAIAERRWHPRHGVAVATIGPLPLPAASSYVARYMEAVSVAGMQSTVHRHSGPEAWYVLSGTQCLETEAGRQVVRAGHTGIVPAGPAMRLGTLGAAKRRALVLVLHDSAEPWMSMSSGWSPKGLCTS